MLHSPHMAAPKWTARTWREWFFEVFAPNSYVGPLRPLPLSEAERQEHAARDHPDKAENITRLDIGHSAEPSRRD